MIEHGTPPTRESVGLHKASRGQTPKILRFVTFEALDSRSRRSFCSRKVYSAFFSPSATPVELLLCRLSAGLRPFPPAPERLDKCLPPCCTTATTAADGDVAATRTSGGQFFVLRWRAGGAAPRPAPPCAQPPLPQGTRKYRRPSVAKN